MTTRLNLTTTGADGTLLSTFPGVALHSGSSDLAKIKTNRLYTDSSGGSAQVMYDVSAASTTVHQTIECDLYLPATGGRLSIPTLRAGGFEFQMNFADDLGLLFAPGGGQMDSEHMSSISVSLATLTSYHFLLEVTSTGAKVFLNGVQWLSGSDSSGTTGGQRFGFQGSGTPTDGWQMSGILAKDFAVGAAAQLAITTPAKRGLSGSTFAIQPVVTVQDIEGLTVTGSTATIVASTATVGCALSGTLSAAAVAGVRTFTNLGWSGATSDAAIVYSSSGLTSATDHPPVAVNSNLCTVS